MTGNDCQLLLIGVRLTCNTKCRAIITAHNCLLFEPATPQSKKFLEIVTPRLTASEGARALAEYRRGNDDYEEDESEAPPFELEMIEGAMMVATGLPSTPFLPRYWYDCLDSCSKHFGHLAATATKRPERHMAAT